MMSNKSKPAPINPTEYKELTFKFSQNDIYLWNIASLFGDLPWTISRVEANQHVGIKVGWIFYKWDGVLITEKNKDEIEQKLMGGSPGMITFNIHESTYPNELQIKDIKELTNNPDAIDYKVDLSKLNEDESIDITGLDVAPEQHIDPGFPETVSIDAIAQQKDLGLPKTVPIDASAPTRPGAPGLRGAAVSRGQGGQGTNNSRPTASMPREPATRQLQPPSMQPSVSQPLTPQMLNAVSASQQKQMIGDRIFPKIKSREPKLCGQITDMLLKMDNMELLYLLENENALLKKISEVSSFINSHYQHQNSPSMQPSVSQPLTPQMLNAVSASQQKQMIGERIFPKIKSREPKFCGQITEMLLEMNNMELLYLIENENAFLKKISEVSSFINSHYQHQNSLREKVGSGFVVRDQRSNYQNTKNKGSKKRR